MPHKPTPADPALVLAYLKALQEHAHAAGISLERLIIAVDYYVLACFDPARSQQEQADVVEWWQRTLAEYGAAANAKATRPEGGGDA
jgi:hypothetical protein